MNIEQLTLTGSPTSFEALKIHLANTMPVVFEDTIKQLEEALVDYRKKNRFYEIAKYLRFATDNPYSHDAMRQLFNGRILSSYCHFRDHPMLIAIFHEIIKTLEIPDKNIHVMEEFQLDAMDDGVPTMIMVVYGDTKYAGLIVECKYNKFQWTIPTKRHHEQGYMGWKSWHDFKTVKELTEQIIEEGKHRDF